MIARGESTAAHKIYARPSSWQTAYLGDRRGSVEVLRKRRQNVKRSENVCCKVERSEVVWKDMERRIGETSGGNQT